MRVALVDRDVFDRRIGKLEQLLRRLARFEDVDESTFLIDEGLQAQAERWLQVSIECALDLANHTIADRGWKTPTSYREAFRILNAEGLIDAGLAAHLADWAGLRNVLVHLYTEIDHRILLRVLREELDHLEAFARIMTEVASADD